MGEDYTLGNDIDLSSISNWEPIGTLANPFTGTLDGNGYKISNLVINRPAADNVGLFGVINTAKSKHAPGDNSVLANPIIKHINFVDAAVDGRDNVGILAGAYITDIGEGNDFRVMETAYGYLCDDIVVVGGVSGRENVGGLIGKASGPLYAGHGPNAPAPDVAHYAVLDNWIIGLKDIVSFVTVSGTGDNIGGVVGNLSAVRLYQCSSGLSVSGANNVGGVVGNVSRASVLHCYSLGDVSATKYVAGGVCGYAYDDGNISNCYSTGNVNATGTAPYNPAELEWETPYSRADVGAGGIVGAWALMCSMSLCGSFGNIEGERAGGLMGTGYCGSFQQGRISECFSRGNIEGRTCAGSIMGLHYAYEQRYLYFSDVYSTGNVSSGYYAGAVVGHKGPVYLEGATQAHNMQYRGIIYYRNQVLVNSKNNMASTANGGLQRTEQQLKETETYRVAWPARVEVEFGSTSSLWLLNPDIDEFPVLKWMNKPRLTMLSAVHSKEQGVVLGYVQGSQGEDTAYSKKGYLRKMFEGSWLDAQEITAIENPDPRLGTFATDDGRVGVIANKGGKLFLAASGAGTLEITETKELEHLQGIYGGLTQLGAEGTRLFYFIPEVNSLARANADYSTTWADVVFSPPGMVDSGLRVSFLRAKRYVNRNRAFLTFRSDGRHFILFPNDVTWNEQPPLPIPGENDPKFNFIVTVFDEDDAPLENVRVIIKKPYDQPPVTQYTDVAGKTRFELHAWNYWISLEKNGYMGVQEEPFDFMSATEKTYKLSLQKGATLFTVSDSAGAVQDATVTYDGDNKQTSAAGEALFPEKPYGDYQYQVSKETYANESGTVSINDATVSEAVMLEKLHALRARLLSLRWFGLADEDSLYRYAADGKLSNHDAELISFMD